MIQGLPLKPRPAGKFIKLYLDGVVYAELKKNAKKTQNQFNRQQHLKLKRL
nr:hypothetical protein KDMBGFOE_00089 [Citrobacter pasteurii]